MTYNHVTLIGIVENDPTIKEIAGRSKVEFRLGVERFRNFDAGIEIDYFNIVVWGNFADVCYDYCKKGVKVLVDGRLQVNLCKIDNFVNWRTEIVCENIKFLKKAGE